VSKDLLSSVAGAKDVIENDDDKENCGVLSHLRVGIGCKHLRTTALSKDLLLSVDGGVRK
jgi:hypothetical protein